MPDAISLRRHHITGTGARRRDYQDRTAARSFLEEDFSIVGRLLAAPFHAAY